MPTKDTGKETARIGTGEMEQCAENVLFATRGYVKLVGQGADPKLIAIHREMVNNACKVLLLANTEAGVLVKLRVEGQTKENAEEISERILEEVNERVQVDARPRL